MILTVQHSVSTNYKNDVALRILCLGMNGKKSPSSPIREAHGSGRENMKELLTLGHFCRMLRARDVKQQMSLQLVEILRGQIARSRWSTVNTEWLGR